MVANPFAFASADSATAVKIGSAAREAMKGIAGRNFSVVEQAQMNDALKQYGYPVDAILSPPLATTLAKNIQARVLMTGTLARGAGGGTSVTARLTGVNDDAGRCHLPTEGQPGDSARSGRHWTRVSRSPTQACIDSDQQPDKAV